MATVFFRLNTAGKDKIPPEDDFTLHAFDNVESPLTSKHAGASNTDHSCVVPETSTSNDEAKYNSPTAFEIKCAQQQGTFYHAAAVLVEPIDCDLTLNKQTKLVKA